MSDAKVFRLDGNTVVELPGKSVDIEKSLQTLMERHLEAFLKVRFIASEYITGKTHGGRIDTLGLDENDCPVIIEYKRSVNENVINQGLYYLDWLLDHRGEFKLLVLERLGKEAADSIDWSGTRLLCIANDFTRYDGHAVQQIGRSIELIRYRKYGDSLLLLELVNAVTSDVFSEAVEPGASIKGPYKTLLDYLAQSPPELKQRFQSLAAYVASIGDDVQRKQLKYYVAFKRLSNFACVEIRLQNGDLLVYTKVDPKSIVLEPDFTRDVSSIGHYGTGDLEIRIKSDEDLERAKPLILQSYQVS